MSIASDAVAQFRTLWAERFIDTIDIVRYATSGTFNTTTLQYDGGTTSTIYSGPGLLRPVALDPSDARLETEQRTLVRYDLFLPYTATGIQPEDRVTISSALLETDVAGVLFRVLASSVDSYATRRAIRLETDLGRGSDR